MADMGLSGDSPDLAELRAWGASDAVRVRFRTVVADPPWPFAWQGGRGGRRANATRLGYQTMTYEQIVDLGPRVQDLSADDATLFLWVTQDALHGGFGGCIAGAWGFGQRIGELVWRKPNYGTGAYPRIGHEICLLYRRGDGSLRSDAPRDVHSVQTWSQVRVRGNGGKQHSAKPDGFYDFVEIGYHGPYVELFARRARFGWEYPLGDQSLSGAAA